MYNTLRSHWCGPCMTVGKGEAIWHLEEQEEIAADFEVKHDLNYVIIVIVETGKLKV